MKNEDLLGARRGAREARPGGVATRVGAPAHQRYLLCKRVLDITLAGSALIILSAPLLLIGLMVRLTSPGPALFRQQRAGKGGRPFVMFKFRSMYHNQSDAPHRAAFKRVFDGFPVEDGSDRPAYKLRGDPRITPIGRFLRRTSLDEVPQLWNVVRGQMSLVGPRPAILYEVDLYRPEHMRRLDVLPGLTGLWQVQGRGHTSFEEMVALDCHYIATCSLRTDLTILARTMAVVLSGVGAG